MVLPTGLVGKNKERIPKFKDSGDSRYIYQNELDKACIQYDMVYGDLKNLPRRTVSDNPLRKKHLIMLKIQKVMNIKEVLLHCFINFLIKNLLLRVHSQRP